MAQVDLRESPIEAMVPEGRSTAETTYPLDIIVFATGFGAYRKLCAEVAAERYRGFAIA